MATLYVVRHGTTPLNSEGRIRSWNNPSLDKQGREEAVKIGESFKDKPINLIYSSDLKRAIETSHEISRNSGAPTITTSALRPLNYGSFNGAKIESVKSELEDLAKRWVENPDVKAPKGESFSDFQDRMHAVVNHVLTQMKSDDHIVISGHSRTINYVRAYSKNKGEKIEGKDIEKLMQDTTEPGKVDTYSYDTNTKELKFGE